MMDALRHFLLIAEHGTFTRAARHAHAFTLADLVIRWIKDAPESGRTAAERLDDVARHFVRIGELPPRTFADLLRSFAWEACSKEAAHLHSMLDEHGRTPLHWVRCVELYLQAMKSCLLAPSWYVPRDLAGGRSTDGALALTQRITRRFGELLHCWPAILHTSSLTQREREAAPPRAATRPYP
jgi:hypothetical protein